MIDSERHHIEESIAACKAAIEACQTCAAEDIRMATNVCALICLDCADICTATLHTLARRSIHHGDFCAICRGPRTLPPLHGSLRTVRGAMRQARQGTPRIKTGPGLARRACLLKATGSISR